MTRESPRKLLYRISQLQAALNTVNSVASSQAVNALTRVIRTQDIGNTSNLTVYTGSGTSVNYINLSSSGAGVWSANSNVAMAVGDTLFVNNSHTLITSLPASSNTIVIDPGIAGDLIASPLIVIKKSTYKPNVADTANSTTNRLITVTSGNVFITPGNFVPGDTFYIHNLSLSGNVMITQNTDVTIYHPNTGIPGGIANSGNKLVGPKGYITITCVSPNTFILSGMGML